MAFPRKSRDDVEAAGAKATMEPKVPDAFTQFGLETKIYFVTGPDGEIVEFLQSRDL